MKTQISLFIFGLIAVASFILAASHVQGQDSCSAKNKHNYLTHVPFDYNNRIIKLNVGIKSGPKRHEFILDSGAPTFITDSLTNAYDLQYLNSETATDVNGNIQNIDFYNIKSIEIGGRQFKRIAAASNKQVADMPLLKGHPYAGLLGANVMRNSIWQINYQCREITLTDRSENLSLPDSAHHIKMKTDEMNRPVITIIIAGKYKVDCIVDVGYNGSLLLPDRFFSKPIFNDSLSYSKEERFSSGFKTEERKIDYKYVRKISMGDLELDNVKASASGNNSVALIGNEFLEKYTIIMNFVDKSLAFVPSEEQCNAKCC